MRIVMLVLVLALGCAASPAAAQLILSTDPPQQPQPQPKAQDHVPPTAKDQAGISVKPETPVTAAATSGRYRFHHIGDGFLRFDNKSGKVSYCSQHTIGWTCQAVPENRAALEQEITHLQGQVAALKKQIATLRAQPPTPTVTPPPATHAPPAVNNGSNVPIKHPTRSDVALARAYLAKTWHRLMEMLVSFQKDMMHKG